MLGGQKISPEHELTETIKMFSGDGKDHHQLHSMIIKGSNKINPASVGPVSINIKMRLYTGMLHEVRDLNQNLFPVRCNLCISNYNEPNFTQNLTETRKLGFGPVVMPGDLRNDLFVTVVRGTFDKGKPGTSGRNIEVFR